MTQDQLLVLLYRISPGCRRKREEFCLQLFFGFYVLRSLGGSIGTEAVVIPVLTGLSAQLGDQVSPSDIWIWSTKVQDQLQILWHRIKASLSLEWENFILRYC
jgi:hypothetical protein